MSVINATSGPAYIFEHIQSGQTINIPQYTQYTVCFRLLNEGTINIIGALCVIL